MLYICAIRLTLAYAATFVKLAQNAKHGCKAQGLQATRAG